MLKSAVLSALAAVSLVQAGPIAHRATTSKDITQRASFDEITIPKPNTLGAQVGTLLGRYLLSFTNIFLLEPGSAPGKVPVGVPSSSGFNVAAYVQPTDLTILPTISIPAGSNVTSFDLKSFNFGCVSGNGNGGATAAARCNIGVVGYRGTTRVASQLIKFAPATAAKSNPIQALLTSDFTGLTRVIFATTFLPDIPNGATYIDDVSYVAHTSLLAPTSSTSTISSTRLTSTSTTSSTRLTSSSTTSLRTTTSLPTGLTTTLPSVTLPSVTLPSVTLPSVTLPSVTLPSVTLPSVTLPSVTLPSVTLPSIGVTSIIPSVVSSILSQVTSIAPVGSIVSGVDSSLTSILAPVTTLVSVPIVPSVVSVVSSIIATDLPL